MTAAIPHTRRHLNAPEWVHLVLVLSILSTLWCAGYVYLGASLTAPTILAGALALLGWRMVSYGTVVSPSLFPVYIAALIASQAMVFEKWLGGYAATLTALFPGAFTGLPLAVDDAIHVGVFGPGAAALFLWGSLGLCLGHPLGAYMAWALFVFAIVDGLTPFAMSVLSGEISYIPGMAAAVLPIAAGLYGIARLRRDAFSPYAQP